jgi:hypothetical protein
MFFWESEGRSQDEMRLPVFGLPALPGSAAKHCAAKGHRNWQAPTSTGSLVVVLLE